MAVVWGILGILLAVYAGLCLMLFLMQSRILYQPHREYAYTPKDVGLDYEAVTLQTTDGQSITGWYIPAAAGNGQWTVLFCHGNAGNISHRLDTLELFYELGLNCLIVDYRGYGQSSGRPTEKGTLLDIKTGWNWLVDQKKQSPARIILFGRSLGGSVAAIVAQEVAPAGVVLESSFTSFVDVGQNYYPFLPVRWFARFDYNTLDAVKHLQCPVFVVHSPDDEIIPYEFGKQLFEAANEPKLFRELKGGHNEGFYENPELYRKIWQDIIDWLNKKADEGRSSAG